MLLSAEFDKNAEIDLSPPHPPMKWKGNPSALPLTDGSADLSAGDDVGDALIPLTHDDLCDASGLSATN